MSIWTNERLDSLIANEVEESLTLDYKASAALQRDETKKLEITKDVSAMANSAGGIIIYGVREYQQKAKAHLPEAIDPVERAEISREWLEHIIQMIRPKIEGVVIYPVPIRDRAASVVYIVDIPQSPTAHQARDCRYYRRYNFESVPMQDHEIRDVMNRRKYPTILAEVRIFADYRIKEPYIAVRLRNTSRIMARHYAVYVEMPLKLYSELIHPEKATLDDTEDGHSMWSFSMGGILASPLFPNSSVILKTSYRVLASLAAKHGPSIPDIRLVVFADEMERLELSKDVSKAEDGWT